MPLGLLQTSSGTFQRCMALQTAGVLAGQMPHQEAAQGVTTAWLTGSAGLAVGTFTGQWKPDI